MSWPEIAQLHNDGFEIGNHTRDHLAITDKTVRDLAAQQAEVWRKGLADWTQGPERIARLRAAAELAVYTPRSRAGPPTSW